MRTLRDVFVFPLLRIFEAPGQARGVGGGVVGVVPEVQSLTDRYLALVTH